jgi:hypothetical protein
MTPRVACVVLGGVVGVTLWAIGWSMFQWVTDTGQVSRKLRELPFDYCDYEEQDQTTAVLRELFPPDLPTNTIFELMRESRFVCAVTFRDRQKRIMVCNLQGDSLPLFRSRSWSIEFHLEPQASKGEKLRDFAAKTYKEC